MDSKPAHPKKSKRTLKIIAFLTLFVLVVGTVLLYFMFNMFLTNALNKSFNKNVISEVYELKFENLGVDIFNGNIHVFNVSLLPRKTPLHSYPYINSVLKLRTKKLLLKNVQIITLLQSNKLILKQISIDNPDVDLELNGVKNNFFPYGDTTVTSKDTLKHKRKKPLNSFMLDEFQLVDAGIQVFNKNKQRAVKISNLNISVYNLAIFQNPGEYLTSFKQIKLSIGSFDGQMAEGAFQKLSFHDFNFSVDSVNLQLTIDTTAYHFSDFRAGLNNFDMQTSDSLKHLTIKSFVFSYLNKSLQLHELNFKPNVSYDQLQKKFKFQKAIFFGSVGSLEIKSINFDSLIFAKKIFIDEIDLKNVTARIYKDKTKPIDTKRFPVYLGQTISKIPLPVRVNKINATEVSLFNSEKKPDGNLANVKLTSGTLTVANITNLDRGSNLVMSAHANLEGKVPFSATLTFPYSKYQYKFEAHFNSFKLTDLNSLINAYAPAKIHKGVCDEISLTGIAEKTSASGTMKFLYHDLDVDLALKKQAKWVNNFLSFTANSVLKSSNPAAKDEPPRIVKFSLQRDMNKGFINPLIKSALNGLKETMFMSKQNRKEFKKTKKEYKQKHE